MSEISGSVNLAKPSVESENSYTELMEKKDLTSVPYGKYVIVHEGDHIKAGTNLCEGAISPTDILHVLGPVAVRDYLVNEIQEVYRLQSVKINDKHIEVIVKSNDAEGQKSNPGDSCFFEEDRVAKREFFAENERISIAVVNDPADSFLEEGSMIDREEFLEINKELKADESKGNLQENPTALLHLSRS